MKKLSIVLLMLIFIIVSAVSVSASEPKTLTYQQAVDMAIANSKTFKNAAADVDRAYELREDAMDDVKIVPLDATDTKAGTAFLGGVKSDYGWRVSQKTYEIARDSISYSVKQAYNTVLLAQKKKEVADLTVQNVYWQSRLVELKYQNGMASSIERMQANSSYTGAQESQKAAAKALNDAYQKFNVLVGLQPNERPILSDLPQYKSVDKIDLETRVSQLTSDSHSVWIADQKVEMAKLDLELYNSKTSSEPYSAKVIDYTKMENSAADARTNLGKQVRTLYYSLKQLEDSYSGLLASLATAELGYKITQVKFDIGMATKSEVITSQLDLEKLKQQMLDLNIQHDNMQMAFDKPWVAQ